MVFNAWLGKFVAKVAPVAVELVEDIIREQLQKLTGMDTPPAAFSRPIATVNLPWRNGPVTVVTDPPKR